MNSSSDQSNHAAADPNDIPLGYWPAINAYYHRYFSQSSLLLAVVAGRGQIDAAALEQSLQVTSRRHPLLNCQLIDADNSMVLRPVAAPAVCLESLQVESLETLGIAQQLLSAGLHEGADAALWHVTLVTSANDPDAWMLVMLCHHAIGDGLSMASFFDQVLEDYSGNRMAGETVFELPLLPEKLTGMEVPPVNPQPAVSEWQIDSFEELSNRSVGLLEISPAVDGLEKLLEACQREKVTLTNLITAALLRACGFTERARVATAADIRRRVNPPVEAEQFGCYAGVVESSVPWASDIWEHARLCAVYQFRGKSRLLMPTPKGAILKHMMTARINNALKKNTCAGGCAVSDVGELPLQQQYGALTIDSVHLAIS
jgi:hypothetical protein